MFHPHRPDVKYMAEKLYMMMMYYIVIIVCVCRRQRRTPKKSARLSRVLENVLLWSLLRETLIMLFRNLCPIMESVSRNRSTIMVSYYGEKSLITWNSTYIIKKSLFPLSLLFTEHTRWKLSKEIIEISLPS